MLTIFNFHNHKDPEIIDSYLGEFTYIQIFGNFKCSKKADHNLEFAGLGLFCDYN